MNSTQLEIPPGDTPSSAQERASRCAEMMFAADQASRLLGIRIASIAPGRARLRMEVTDAMINGHGMCHGGYLFTLADSAFAFACNTYDEVTVAAGADINFLEPAHRGELLEAEAVERLVRGRSGIYDVTVRRVSDSHVLAEFRGRSRRLGQSLLGASGTSFSESAQGR